MTVAEQALAVFDERPFFERALRHGVQQGLLDRVLIERMRNDAPKGIVQIADHFGSAYLRPNIEQARLRLVNLISLYLAEHYAGNLDQAARSLRDNTLLSHSRGGSEMLKSLWSLPEDTSLGASAATVTQKTFLAEWSLRTLADYRRALAQRQANQSAIAAAHCCLTRAGQTTKGLDGTSAEAVLRSALLVALSGKSPPFLPNGSQFLALLKQLRGKSAAAKFHVRRQTLSDDMPSALQPVVEHEWQRLETNDLPQIANRDLSIERLYNELAPLYFLRDFDLADGAPLALVSSSNWQEITGGKYDDGSLLTVFVCLAAGVPAKPSLSRKAARALIQKSRSDGLHSEPVPAFIRDHAPYAMQDDLLVLWQEFFDEAQIYLLDESDDTLGQAIRFLQENCVIV
ncbi:MAG TPA: hypothetical protein PLB97_04245 [Accumulibacter sp.]|jgi:hypothetical protein|nr:hypothetical protein [Accumulibacter sp.]HPP47569.1 hypothetical protein [Accumulibacter sp.]